MEIEDTELMELLDGELPPERAAWLARQIVSSPDLQRREQEMRALLGICSAAFAAVPANDPRLPVVVDVRVPMFAPAPAGAHTPLPLAPVPDQSVVNLAEVRARRDVRRRPASSWLRAAAVLLVVGGGGIAIGRALRPATDPTDALAATDPALRSALAQAHGAASTPPVAQGPVPTRTSAGSPHAMPPTVEDRDRSATVARAEPPSRAPTGPPGREYFVEVASTVARVVGAADGGVAVGGTKELALGDGTRLELAYGPAAVGQGGTPVTITPGVIPDLPRSTSGEHVAIPNAASGLDGAARHAPNAGPVGSPVCADAIRWRDPATGVELRLRGALACDRLQALAATLRISMSPR